MDFVSGALYLGSTVRKNLMQEATDLSKLDNPNSVGQLTQWLQEEMGEELTDLRKDTVSRLLNKDGNSPQVQRMLEIRQELGKTSTKNMMPLRLLSARMAVSVDCSNFTEPTAPVDGQADWCRCKTCPALI